MLAWTLKHNSLIKRLTLTEKLAGSQALSQAQGIAGLVGAGQRLGFDQSNALMQVGAAGQQMGQASKDLAYLTNANKRIHISKSDSWLTFFRVRQWVLYQQ